MGNVRNVRMDSDRHTEKHDESDPDQMCGLLEVREGVVDGYRIKS